MLDKSRARTDPVGKQDLLDCLHGIKTHHWTEPKGPCGEYPDISHEREYYDCMVAHGLWPANPVTGISYQL